MLKDKLLVTNEDDKKDNYFLFYEDFDSRENRFIKDNIEGTTYYGDLRVSTGILIFNGPKKWYESRTNTIQLKIPSEKYFVESDFSFWSKKSGNKNQGSGIFVGWDSETYLTCNIIPAGGFLHVQLYKKGSRKISKLIYNNLLKGKFKNHKLRIEKLGDTFKIYINDKMIYTFEEKFLSFKKFGFDCYGGNEMSIKYFHIQTFD